MKTDVLIVGGSAAGLAGAITTRRFNPKIKICIVRKEKAVLVPCGIPYMFGTLKSMEDNLIPDAVLEAHNIDLLVDTVVSIDKEAKTVKTEGGEIIEYDRMILATGSSPFVPPLPGKDLENVFTVWKDLDYLKSLKKAIQEAKDVIIKGGG